MKLNHYEKIKLVFSIIGNVGIILTIGFSAYFSISDQKIATSNFENGQKNEQKKISFSYFLSHKNQMLENIRQLTPTPLIIEHVCEISKIKRSDPRLNSELNTLKLKLSENQELINKINSDLYSSFNGELMLDVENFVYSYNFYMLLLNAFIYKDSEHQDINTFKVIEPDAMFSYMYQPSKPFPNSLTDKTKFPTHEEINGFFLNAFSKENKNTTDMEMLKYLDYATIHVAKRLDEIQTAILKHKYVPTGLKPKNETSTDDFTGTNLLQKLKAASNYDNRLRSKWIKTLKLSECGEKFAHKNKPTL